MSAKNPTRSAPAIQDDPRYRLVPLADGGFTIVDAEDYERVAAFKWHRRINNSKTHEYAGRVVYREGRQHLVLLHRFLFGLTDADRRIKVDHENGDGLDNRRSCNLRLGTQRQNCANRRRLKRTSPYRGSYWHKVNRRWTGVIGINRGGYKKTIVLGSYDTAEEAAFAFHVAAPLIRDPAFLQLDPIPDEKLPTPDRQAEIRRTALAKLKAALAGQKRPEATSRLHHVCRRHKGYQAIVKVKGRDLAIHFKEEIEAAFAADCLIRELRLTRRRLNNIEPSDLSSPDRAEEIERRVRAFLAARP